LFVFFAEEPYFLTKPNIVRQKRPPPPLLVVSRSTCLQKTAVDLQMHGRVDIYTIYLFIMGINVIEK
jgi:hypothetical protein